MAKVYSILTFLILAVIMVGCDKKEEIGEHDFYSIDIQVTGLSPVSTTQNKYHLIYEVPQEGATLHVVGSGKNKSRTYVDVICVGNEEIYLKHHISYYSDDVNIVYPKIGTPPEFDIVIPANVTNDTKDICIHLGLAGPCLNVIEIIQPGLIAE